MSSGQGTRFCFTINNPSVEDCEGVIEVASSCRYLICGDEVGESGTPHLQGYLVLPKKTRIKTLSKRLPRAAIYQARGTSEQNRVYCSKGGKFEEYGQCPSDTRITSERASELMNNRWHVARELAKSGRIDEIEPELYIRYLRTFERIAINSRAAPVINDQLFNLWIYGGTGTGKTSWCWKNFPDHYQKLKNKWWCDYKNEKVVIMQEFGRVHSKLSEHVKEWADHYPFRAEFKTGGGVYNFKVLIITSNYSIDQIWSEDEIVEPMNRRFNSFKFPDEVPDEQYLSRIREYIA